MRPSIEPDVKGPVRIAGPAQRQKTRSRQTSILDTGEAPFRCAPCRESKTDGGDPDQKRQTAPFALDGKEPVQPYGCREGSRLPQTHFLFTGREGGRLLTFNTGQKRPWPFRCAPC